MRAKSLRYVESDDRPFDVVLRLHLNVHHGARVSVLVEEITVFRGLSGDGSHADAYGPLVVAPGADHAVAISVDVGRAGRHVLPKEGQGKDVMGAAKPLRAR